MASSNNIDVRPEDLLLVDLLYGEIEGDEAAEATSKIEADDDLAGTLQAFGSIRALMRELPDEDPPPAITAQLLHAAATTVKSPSRVVAVDAATSGAGFFAWLKRFFQPIFMSPALAAAATFVLVAGVAGALYVTGNFEKAQPEVASNAEAPGRRLAEPATAQPGYIAPETTDTSETRGRVDLPVSRGPADIVVSGEIIAPNDDGDLDEDGFADVAAPAVGGFAKGEKPRGKAAKRKGQATHRSTMTVDERKGRREGEKVLEFATKKKPATKKPTQKRKDRSRANTPAVTGSAGDSVLVDAEEDPNEPAGSRAPSPEPAQQEVPPKRDKKEISARTQARDLHAKAVQASKDGECQAVVSLGARISRLDASFYKTVYLRDKRLSSCRTRPAKKKK